MKIISRLVFIFTAIIIFFANASDLAAYEADTHYAWTYYLALHVGFTHRQAYQIASGAYAIDEDPDTGPMEATTGDFIHGANYGPGELHPRLAFIWRNFHAFSGASVEEDAMDKEKETRRLALRKMAAEEGNPGPLIHFVQDLYSHAGFDDIRGHSLAGHAVDFLSFDRKTSQTMTYDTIMELSWFMQNVVGEKPYAVDFKHIYEVLDKVIAANPDPPTKLHQAVTTNLDWKCKSGVPVVSKAVSVLNEAIEKDESDGLLPRWRDDTDWRHPEWMQSVDILKDLIDGNFGTADWLPFNWFSYNYSDQGRVGEPQYRLEMMRLETKEPEIRIEEINENTYNVIFRLPYRLSGMVDGVNFLSPIPTIVIHQLATRLPSGALHIQWERKVTATRLCNNTWFLEYQMPISRSLVDSQNLVWECTLYVLGLPPKISHTVITKKPSIPGEKQIVWVLKPEYPRLNPENRESWDTISGDTKDENWSRRDIGISGSGATIRVHGNRDGKPHHDHKFFFSWGPPPSSVLYPGQDFTMDINAEASGNLDVFATSNFGAAIYTQGLKVEKKSTDPSGDPAVGKMGDGRIVYTGNSTYYCKVDPMAMELVVVPYLPGIGPVVRYEYEKRELTGKEIESLQNIFGEETGSGFQPAPLPPAFTLPASASSESPLSPPPAVQPDPAGSIRSRQSGDELWNRGDVDGALHWYNEAIRQNPLNYGAHVGRGHVYAIKGEYANAIADYRNALSLLAEQQDPSPDDVRHFLVEILLASSRMEEASIELLVLEIPSPSNAYTMVLRGQYYLRQGDVSRASQVFSQAMQVDPNIPQTFYQAAIHLLDYKQWERALLLCDTIEMLDGNKVPSVYYVRGAAYAGCGQKQEAIQSYERYLQYDGTSEWANQARAAITELQS